MDHQERPEIPPLDLRLIIGKLVYIVHGIFNPRIGRLQGNLYPVKP